MPSILFYKAPSWAVLWEQADRWCTHTSNALLITPPECKEAVQIQCPGAWAVYTTRELLTACIAGQYNNRYLVTDQAAAYLLQTIIKQETTKYLNIETHHNGYVKALCEFIQDFRQNYPGDLYRFFKNSGKSKLTARERDLVDIHNEYEKQLGDKKLFDYRSAMEWFVADREKVKNTGLPGSETLVILWAGFSHISSLDALFFKSLLTCCKQAVFLYCENKKAAVPSFRIQDSLLNFFASVREQYTDDREISFKADEKHRFLLLAESFFKTGKKGAGRVLPLNAKITAANNRYDEVVQLARQIRKHMDNGVSLQAMRVVFPDYALYTALVQEIFGRYRISYSLEAGIPLLFFPLARLVKDMVLHAIAPNPYQVREKIFSSPYISFSCRVDAEVMEEFSGKYGAAAFTGKHTMSALFPRPVTVSLDYEAILYRQRAAMRTMRSFEKTDPLILVLAYINASCGDKPALCKKEQAKALADYYVLRQAEKALYVFSRKPVPGEFTGAIRRLLEVFAVRANALKKDKQTDNFIIKQDTAVLETVEKLLEKWETEFAQPAFDRERLLLTDQAYSFISLMSDPASAVPHRTQEGVQISTPAAAGPASRSHTWICGLVDGSFPSLDVFNFLKPRKGGQDIFKHYSSIDLCRFQLYQLIAATREGLYLSYPLSDGGKKVKVSPFITELEKWLPAQNRDDQTGEESLYTTREKLSVLAINVDHNYPAAKKLLKKLKQSDPVFFTHITGLLQSDGLRSSHSTFTEFDGMILHPGALPAISLQVKKFPGFSAEQLERYAGCPLRFLFDDMEQLKPGYLTDYYPDTSAQGKVLKQLLTDYTAEIVKNHTPPGKRAKILHTLALNACQTVTGEKDDLFSGRFRNNLLMGLNQKNREAKRPGLLKAFLDYEVESPDLITPFMAQVSVKYKCGTVSVPIIIERVDITSGKQFLIAYTYSIAGHGNVPAIHKGLSFLLPLQILGLRRLLQSGNSPYQVGGAGIYLVKNIRSIKRGGYLALKQLQSFRKDKVSAEAPLFSGQRQFGFLDPDSFENVLQTVEGNVKKIREFILRGKFHPPLCAQQDQTCANCHFTRICRIDQLRQDSLYNRLGAEDVYKPLRSVQLP